jgi:hypothetical protein
MRWRLSGVTVAHNLIAAHALLTVMPYCSRYQLPAKVWKFVGLSQKHLPHD